MNNFELYVNKRIEVVSNDKSYKSLISDIDDDDDSVKINIPVREGEYLVLDSGEVIEINMYHESGKCYSFKGKVLSKGRDGNIPYYKLSEPFDIKRIQRRSYFRVGILNHAHYRKITNYDSNQAEHIPYSDAMIIDLSGGGVKLKINEEVNLHDVLSVRMKIKGSDIIVNGEVVRVELSEDKQSLCGVKFLNISQVQTDKIVEELFEIMRRQRALK